MNHTTNTYRVLVALTLTLLAPARAADLIPLGSTWNYILGTGEASTPANAWREIGFDDSAWPLGVAPIGYDTAGTPGTSPIVTLLPDPRTAGNPSWNSTYFRKAFDISEPGRVANAVVTLYVDDGAVIWLNGREVGRINVPDGEMPYNGASLVADETRVLTTTNLSSLLVAGKNALAIHAFNGPAASSDFVVEAVLTADLDDPPAVSGVDPWPSSIVTRLDYIDVTFSESVTGVDASDLLINGSPATNLTVISPREYVFNFPSPPKGTTTVAWAASPGISDLDGAADAFVPGAGWHYTIDPNAIRAPVIISEFMADNEHGIRDEDGTRSDWIELYNAGTTDANLRGWFLTDTPTNLTQWSIPSVNLGVNKYLLIFASGKDRANPAAPLHTNFKLSKNAGSYLALVDPETNVVSVFESYPAQSSDVSYGRDRADPNLTGYFVASTPGAQNAISGVGFAPEPVFSRESGVYTNNSLTLSITAPAGTTIRYTMDGSEPATNSPVFAGAMTFSTNLTIKARVFQPGVFPSAVGSRTFLMLDSSTRDFNSNIPLAIISTCGRSIPRNLPAGSARPRGTFITIDTFRGRTSMQSRTDYQGLAQFEIVGQTSADFSWNSIPKPPYRVELNDELGNDLDAPLLGMPAEADWILRSPFTDKCLMNDFLGYELWGDMGYYSCRGRLVELFVDTGGGKLSYPGDYYGVYVLFERIKIGKDRVDLSKLTPSNTNEPSITGGYIIKQDKDSAGDTAFSTPGGAGHSGHVLKFHDPKPSEITLGQSNWIRNYVNRFEATMYAANWTNATGTNHYSAYIDVDAFVDQHLHVEFTKNIDGYRLSSYYSKDRDGKLKPGPVWDWNLSFGNANYLQGGKTNGWYWNLEYEADAITSAKHVWLRRLIYGLPVITTAAPWTDSNGPGDPDFRQRITDRWAVARTNILNGERVVARIEEVAALLAEAADRNYARFFGLLNSYTWPNPEGAPSWDVDYTQPTYAAIISEMRKWTRGRWMWMDSQFIPTPLFSRSDGAIGPGATLTITATSGTVYYTVDGTDPRLSGGAISPLAKVYSGPIPLSGNARVTARAFVNPTTLWTPWSAAQAATFVAASPRLVISEIMYHPATPPAGSTNQNDDFEYLELKNVGSGPLELQGFSISGGVSFVFPSRTLGAGQRILVVKDQASFASRYGSGLPVAGEFAGNLANDGDHVVLKGPLLEPILDFRYDDQWHPITDGPGFSLVAVDENAAAAAWGTKAQWRPSGVVLGTPGQGEAAAPALPRVVVNEALTHSDPPPPYDTIELRNLEGTNVNLGGWFLTDDFSAPKKYRIAGGTQIPAQGYLTFDETMFNAAGGVNVPFALSSHGDEVYLFSADAEGELTGYVHGFAFGAAPNGVTFGRHILSTGEEHFVAQAAPTLGTNNGSLRVGPIVITEIMYHPPDVYTNGAYWNNTEDEYVEFRNISGTETRLYDLTHPTNSWKIIGAIEFVFPTNFSLPAGAYALLVNFDPAGAPGQLAAFRAKYGVSPDVAMLGPYGKSLDNGNGTVGLYMPDTPEVDGLVPYVVVDRVRYRDDSPWPVSPDGLGHALHRLNVAEYGDDPINWTGAKPTPGSALVGGLGPAITLDPVSQSAPLSGSATFTARASGPGTLRYQWRFGSHAIEGATNSWLALSNVQSSQAGSFQLVAMNEFGCALSREARLTVIVPATIIQQPASLVVTNGGDAAFSVVATTANPPLSYQWFREGLPIAGATNSSLDLTHVEEAVHNGVYVVAVTDAAATIQSAPAMLTVLAPPFLAQPVPPVRITTVAGQTIQLSAEAVGTRPMLFRWRRILTNGANAIIANHSVNSHSDYLTISNVATAFNGATFTVTLTNAAYTLLNRTFTNCILSVLPDSNGNGIPDAWELAYFGSATGANRDEDSDGDTMSNWSEYVAGTDPTNAASYLKVDRVVPGGATEITFQAVSNRAYSVLYKDDLSAATWARLSDVVARSTNWTAAITDPAITTNRFYRITTPTREQ